MKSAPSIHPLRVGDAVVQLVQTNQREFIGLGRVTIAGVPVRSAARPITVRLDTPAGLLYTRLLVEKVKPAADRVEIILQAIGLPWGQEYNDEYQQPTVTLDSNVAPVTDRLSLILRPVALDVGGRRWTGFSYSFEFTSSSRQIHRLLTQATWEIGGRITGNTVLSQGQCNRPVYRGAKHTLFTTACLRTLEQHGQPQGNSFQLGPRAGLIQGFDFQFVPGRGALWQFWPELKSVSSLVESPPGADVLHVVDEYRFELAKNVVTTPKWVVFTKGALREHAARDLWWDVCQHVYGGIRKQFHIAPSIVKPFVFMKYETILDGQRHQQSGAEWKTAAARRTAGQASRLQMSVAGQVVDHAEYLYAVADHLLPRLKAQGLRRFYPEMVSQSDVTELGLQRKLDNGVHGELHCSSVCATHRFFPAEFWGGIKAWRYLATKTRSLGLEIGHWFAPHFSPRSALYRAHPEYRMIDAQGFPAGGGYGIQSIIVADWNTGIRGVVLDDLRRWQEEGGLDFLFVDSYANMGLLQANYSARMRTNYAAFARLLADLQGIGIKSFGFESVSALGVAMFGVSDLRGDLLEQNKAVAGQNDFGWWVGAEDMLFNCWLHVDPRKRQAAELQRIQFRALANRGYVSFASLFDSAHILPGWWARLNHIYNQVVPHMQQRRLLPNGAGVRWSDGTTDVLWLFADYLPTGRAGQIERVEPTGFVPIASSAPARLSAWNVYQFTPG